METLNVISASAMRSLVTVSSPLPSTSSHSLMETSEELSSHSRAAVVSLNGQQRMWIPLPRERVFAAGDLRVGGISSRIGMRIYTKTLSREKDSPAAMLPMMTSTHRRSEDWTCPSLRNTSGFGRLRAMPFSS